MPDALISQSSQDKQQSIIKSCSYNFTGVWINLPIGYFSVCPAAQSSRGRHLSPSALQPEPRKGFGFPPALLLTYFSMLPDVGIRDKKNQQHKLARAVSTVAAGRAGVGSPPIPWADPTGHRAGMRALDVGRAPLGLGPVPSAFVLPTAGLSCCRTLPEALSPAPLLFQAHANVPQRQGTSSRAQGWLLPWFCQA